MGKKNCKCDDICFCKKNNSKELIVFIIVLVSLLLFFAGLIVGSFLIFDNQDNITNKNDECLVETRKDMSDYELIKHKIDEFVMFEALNRDIDNMKDVDINTLMIFAYETLSENKGQNLNSFTLSELNEVLKEYFDITIDGQNILCDFCDEHSVLFKYETKTQTFLRSNEEHGHEGRGLQVLNRIVSILPGDGVTYEVEVVKAFGDSPYLITTYYPTYQDMLDEKNILFDMEIDGEYFYPEVEFNKISNYNLKKYKYIFEKKGDNFILKSYKIGR